MFGLKSEKVKFSDRDVLIKEWRHKHYFYTGRVIFFSDTVVEVQCGDEKMWVGSKEIFQQEWR